MFAGLAKSIFGSANDRYVRSLGKYVDAVGALEPQIQALSDEELGRVVGHQPVDEALLALPVVGADVLKAQTQVSRMQDELLRLARERPVIEAELVRALGRRRRPP